MSDLISRQAAIDVIDAVLPVDPMKSEYAQGIACGAALAKTYVEQMPSAQPEQRWIPCNWHRDNENLPEECKSVLICIVDGNKICVDVSYRTDYNRWERYGRVDVTAWMPLPEPYKEGEQDE